MANLADCSRGNNKQFLTIKVLGHTVVQLSSCIYHVTLITISHVGNLLKYYMNYNLFSKIVY